MSQIILKNNIFRKRFLLRSRLMQHSNKHKVRKFVQTKALYMNESEDENLASDSDTDSNSQYSKVSDISINSQTSDLEGKKQGAINRIEHYRKEASDIRKSSLSSIRTDITALIHTKLITLSRLDFTLFNQTHNEKHNELNQRAMEQERRGRHSLEDKVDYTEKKRLIDVDRSLLHK